MFELFRRICNSRDDLLELFEGEEIRDSNLLIDSIVSYPVMVIVLDAFDNGYDTIFVYPEEFE